METPTISLLSNHLQPNESAISLFPSEELEPPHPKPYHSRGEFRVDSGCPNGNTTLTTFWAILAPVLPRSELHWNAVKKKGAPRRPWGSILRMEGGGPSDLQYTLDAAIFCFHPAARPPTPTYFKVDDKASMHLCSFYRTGLPENALPRLLDNV